MFDIHCHILHGLDDGSDNLEESVRMARLAVDGGAKAVIATPHCNIPGSYQNYCSKEYKSKIIELNLRLKSEGIDLKVYPGHEIFAADDFVEKIKSETVLTRIIRWSNLISRSIPIRYTQSSAGFLPRV